MLDIYHYFPPGAELKKVFLIFHFIFFVNLIMYIYFYSLKGCNHKSLLFSQPCDSEHVSLQTSRSSPTSKPDIFCCVRSGLVIGSLRYEKALPALYEVQSDKVLIISIYSHTTARLTHLC